MGNGVDTRNARSRRSRGGGGPFIAHDGGRALRDEQIDREWLDAWAGIAHACERGLSGLQPMHPRRDELVALLRARDARAAARLSPVFRPVKLR